MKKPEALPVANAVVAGGWVLLVNPNLPQQNRTGISCRARFDVKFYC